MSSDSTKPEEPKGLLQKLGAALPIGLTALATVFAGMSTGALQQAMYWKSQAAQDQSKATNQWSLAGFKRDRALTMQTSAAQLRAMSEYRVPMFAKPGTLLSGQDELQAKALGWLIEEKGDKAGPPRVKLPEITDENIKALRDGIETRQPETELLALAAKVNKDAINKAIDDTEKAVEQVDKEWDPIIKVAATLVQIEAIIRADAPDDERKKKAANATAAQATGFELEQRRYRAESFMNQAIAFLYEIRVKVSTAESDKHRRKSQHFFYAMLAAQVGAVISSLAIARQKMSVLWFFASFIGLVSIGIGAYVFLEG
ncbi:MAG: hypothetical protein C0467_25840 [Planctomycetaceae bacterium]|nr:hypothetical protein [Planctomycetaceae bacterium]